jgi:hypothetical protein
MLLLATSKAAKNSAFVFELHLPTLIVFFFCFVCRALLDKTSRAFAGCTELPDPQCFDHCGIDLAAHRQFSADWNQRSACAVSDSVNLAVRVTESGQLLLH